MKYDIHNPLQCRRIIHDGLTQITVEAGATKSGVEMSDGLAKEMQARKGDLEITPVGTGRPSVVPPAQPHIADEGNTDSDDDATSETDTGDESDSESSEEQSGTEEQEEEAAAAPKTDRVRHSPRRKRR